MVIFELKIMENNSNITIIDLIFDAVKCNNLTALRIYLAQEGVTPEILNNAKKDDDFLFHHLVFQEELKDKNIDPKYDDDQLEIIKLLLENGINPDALNCFGSTLLYFAVCWFKPTLVTLLLQFGADMLLKNKFGDSALSYAYIKLDECKHNKTLEKGVMIVIVQLFENAIKNMNKPQVQDQEQEIQKLRLALEEKSNVLERQKIVSKRALQFVEDDVERMKSLEEENDKLRKEKKDLEKKLVESMFVSQEKPLGNSPFISNVLTCSECGDPCGPNGPCFCDMH